MIQIIKYLKSKPLGFQTLMDSLYIQLIQYWILESFMTFVTIILIQIQENNWILAWLVGFGTYLAMLLSSLHLIICLIFQIQLIWYQSVSDTFEDEKVLEYIRYKFKINSKLNLKSISFRIFEFCFITTLGIVLQVSSNVPKLIYIIQGIEVSSAPFQLIILASLSWGSTILQLIFKIFVHFSICKQSKNLLRLRTIVILAITIHFPILAPMIFSEDSFVIFAYKCSIIMFLKFFIIPLEIVISHSDMKKLHNLRHQFMKSYESNNFVP